MNIAFLLLPKQDVAYVFESFTVRQALEKMKYHGYQSIPMLNKEGKYVGTISEGDLLWAILDWQREGTVDLEKRSLADVPLRTQHEAVSVYDDVQTVLDRSVDQNFISVKDDAGFFIGIIRRKDIIEFLTKQVDTKQPNVS
ncbi:CBS domain-containing protein [Mangrovibacillus cuniculi]|uniref:CBS domain-containing protein n=1 Tax=Mangrovibacillus cuniculi TaxID=2593652 RepID=A0A7S8C9E6_9BACI|nr:CBS domain-containing protein [Mangrovibacillus cuniculi]QPC45835.1 CBS domain-containing protein [Mangrovibacillus cuniculi]